MLDSLKEEKRTDLLIQIVSQRNRTITEQLYFALESTCKLLGMEIGIISRIHDQTYSVEHFFPIGIDLSKGQEFDLGDTYCSITLDSEKPFSVAHMAQSEYNMHPCYNAFHLESYIGVSFDVNGELYGTINFSSSLPREKGFSAADLSLITLLGEWVSGLIQRKLIEEELQKEKEQYKLLSTNSADLVCLHELDGTFTFVSESSIEMLGFNPEELVGTSPYELIHPQDIERDPELIFDRVKQGTPIGNTEYRIKRQVGDYIWVNIAAEPIISESGKVTGIQTRSRDVSKQKRLEILFNESQEMAHVGGWEYDLKTGKLYWTEEVYRIHDKTVNEEIFVEEGLSYFPGEARNLIENAIQHTIETGEQYDLELPFISAKNVSKWVRAIGKVEFADGEAYKLHGTFQDITERKRDREQISEQNERLFQEKKTKEKLYSILAHDLKNSLFGLSDFLEITIFEIVEDVFNKETALERFGLISTSTKSSIKLLETIQSWVKIQAGYFTVVPNMFNIANEVELVIDLFQPGLRKKNINLNKNLSNLSNTDVYGDSEMISTVIRNLVNNAVKYSKKDSEIEINLIKADQAGFLNLVIKDQGIGMSEEILRSLFDFDNRPQRKGTDDEPGTGLGLMLCKELAEQNNVSIFIKSKAGKGTEITLQLPSSSNTKAKTTIECTPDL